MNGTAQVGCATDVVRQMRILHVVPGLDDPTCGIAVAAKAIARQQAASGACTVEMVSSSRWIKAQIAAADEVWVHSMWTLGVMRAAWTALRRGRRLVRMPHGCLDPVRLKYHWFKKMWVAPLERWLFTRANAVIGTIPDEISQIRAFASCRGAVLLRALKDPKTILDMPMRPVRSSGHAGACARDGLRLLYVGRLHPLKGVALLIRALDSRFSLTVVGKDEGEAARLRLLAEKVGARVTFCGVLVGDEKNAAIDACDVLVLPTLSENFGLVVAEALERGKPVVTTDGAPAWKDEPRTDANGRTRLVYLEGYRAGTDAQRIALLKGALERFWSDGRKGGA